MSKIWDFLNFFVKILDKWKFKDYNNHVIWKNYNSLCGDGGTGRRGRLRGGSFGLWVQFPLTAPK